MASYDRPFVRNELTADQIAELSTFCNAVDFEILDCTLDDRYPHGYTVLVKYQGERQVGHPAPKEMQTRMYVHTLFEYSFFSNQEGLAKFEFKLIDALRKFYAPASPALSKTDQAIYQTVTGIVPAPVIKYTQKMILIFNQPQNLDLKVKTVKQLCNRGMMFGLTKEERLKLREEAKQEVNLRRQRAQLKKDKGNAEKIFKSKVRELKEVSKDDNSTWSDEGVRELTSHILSLREPRDRSVIADIWRSTAFKQYILEHSLSPVIKECEDQLKQTVGYIFNTAHAKKYCLYPGTITINQHDFSLVDFYRVKFGPIFKIYSDRAKQPQQQPKLHRAISAGTAAQARQEIGYSQAAPDVLISQQKEMTYNIIRDQVQAFGIMMNFLMDNTVFLNKGFTAMIMALMRGKGNYNNFTTHVKTEYTSLTDYYAFDNNFSFYKFGLEYTIMLNKDKIYAELPGLEVPQQPEHLLKMIAKWFSQEEGKRMPFIIELRRQNSDGAVSTEYAVVKYGIELDPETNAASPCLCILEPSRTRRFFINRLLTDQSLNGNNPLDLIFNYLKIHYVQSHKKKDRQVADVGMEHQGVDANARPINGKYACYKQARIFRPTLVDDLYQQRDVRFNAVAKNFQIFSKLHTVNHVVFAESIASQVFDQSVKDEHRRYLCDLIKGMLVADSHSAFFDMYKTTLGSLFHGKLPDMTEVSQSQQVGYSILQTILAELNLLGPFGGITFEKSSGCGIEVLANKIKQKEEFVRYQYRLALKTLSEAGDLKDAPSAKVQHYFLLGSQKEFYRLMLEQLKALKLILLGMLSFMQAVYFSILDEYRAQNNITRGDIQSILDGIDEVTTHFYTADLEKLTEQIEKNAAKYKFLQENPGKERVLQQAEKQFQSEEMNVMDMQPDYAYAVGGVEIKLKFPNSPLLTFILSGISHKKQFMRCISKIIDSAAQGLRYFEPAADFITEKMRKLDMSLHKEDKVDFVQADPDTNLPYGEEQPDGSINVFATAFLPQVVKFLWMAQGQVWFPLSLLQDPANSGRAGNDIVKEYRDIHYLQQDRQNYIQDRIDNQSAEVIVLSKSSMEKIDQSSERPSEIIQSEEQEIQHKPKSGVQPQRPQGLPMPTITKVLENEQIQPGASIEAVNIVQTGEHLDSLVDNQADQPSFQTGIVIEKPLHVPQVATEQAASEQVATHAEQVKKRKRRQSRKKRSIDGMSEIVEESYSDNSMHGSINDGGAAVDQSGIQQEEGGSFIEPPDQNQTDLADKFIIAAVIENDQQMTQLDKDGNPLQALLKGSEGLQMLSKLGKAFLHPSQVQEFEDKANQFNTVVKAIVEKVNNDSSDLITVSECRQYEEEQMANTNIPNEGLSGLPGDGQINPLENDESDQKTPFQDKYTDDASHGDEGPVTVAADSTQDIEKKRDSKRNDKEEIKVQKKISKEGPQGQDTEETGGFHNLKPVKEVFDQMKSSTKKTIQDYQLGQTVQEHQIVSNVMHKNLIPPSLEKSRMKNQTGQKKLVEWFPPNKSSEEVDAAIVNAFQNRMAVMSQQVNDSEIQADIDEASARLAQNQLHITEVDSQDENLPQISKHVEQKQPTATNTDTTQKQLPSSNQSMAETIEKYSYHGLPQANKVGGQILTRSQVPVKVSTNIIMSPPGAPSAKGKRQTKPASNTTTGKQGGSGSGASNKKK